MTATPRPAAAGHRRRGWSWPVSGPKAAAVGCAAAAAATLALGGCALTTDAAVPPPRVSAPSAVVTGTSSPTPAVRGMAAATPLGGSLTTAPGTSLVGEVGTVTTGTSAGWYATLTIGKDQTPASVISFYRHQLRQAGFTLTADAGLRLEGYAPTDSAGWASATASPSGLRDPSTGPAADQSGDPAGAGVASVAAVPAGTYVDIDAVAASSALPGYVRLISTTL